MTNYVRTGLVLDLERRGLVDDSLHATLLAHGLRPVHAVDTVEARPATEEEADLLRVAPESPLLQVSRVSYDREGNPLDVAVVANRADRFRYTIRFGSDRA
jgi:GntR family transcriptional regulator